MIGCRTEPRSIRNRLCTQYACSRARNAVPPWTPAGRDRGDPQDEGRRTKDHGLDLADLSLGFNTDAMANPPMNRPAFMIERARPVRSEVGIPVATSGKLGIPREADRASPR